MIRRPPRSTLTDTLFPSTTLFRSMKSLGIVDRLTRLPIAELDTVRRPSISTRVRLSPRLRSWIDDRPEFWVLPVTGESLSVDESCGRSAEIGRGEGRARVCQYGSIMVIAG